MKKAFTLSLILVLALGIAGCDFLVNDQGVGKLIVTADDFEEKDSGNKIDAKDVTVKVNGKKAIVGEPVTLVSGEYDVLLISDSYGKQIKDVQVKAADTTTWKNSENTVTLKKAVRDVTFTVNPADFPDIDFADKAEVSLMGMVWDTPGKDDDGDGEVDETNEDGANWIPGAPKTIMNKKSDGTYELTVENVKVGYDYKFVVNNKPSKEWDWGSKKDYTYDSYSGNKSITIQEVFDKKVEITPEE